MERVNPYCSRQMLNSLPRLPSTSIHLIRYNVIDIHVSGKEWSIILHLSGPHKREKAKGERAGLKDTDALLRRL